MKLIRPILFAADEVFRELIKFVRSSNRWTIAVSLHCTKIHIFVTVSTGVGTVGKETQTHF